MAATEVPDIDGQSDDPAWTVILTAASIDAVPWEPFGGLRGMRQRVLWRAGDSYAGLLRLDPGSEVALHQHRRAHHHVWVVSGTCTTLGTAVTAGSYIHVPAGVGHSIEGVGNEGCTLFYLYLREPEAMVKSSPPSEEEIQP